MPQSPMPDANRLIDELAMFAGLDASARTQIAATLTQRSLARGDRLVQEGEAADTLFIVVSGRFAVRTAALAGATLAEIGAGEPIGEIAFLTGARRTATVTALRDSIVASLDRAAFERIGAANPTLWRSLAVALAGRVAATNRALDRARFATPRTIAVIRAGRAAMPRRFLDMLVAVLAANARVTVLDAAGAARLVPAGNGLDSSVATRALNAAEAGAERLLLLADAELTEWTEKALHQADLVLAVGVHADEAGLNDIERRAAILVEPHLRRLVLIHPKRRRLAGTRRWLAPRGEVQHHHVALDGGDDGRADIERLDRFIRGTARGLVACGGGAFSAAHVGLYKSLTRDGASFDMMGGTSGGSAMTAAFALGFAPDDIDRAIHDIFVRNKAMRRYTWPRYSLIDHTHFDALLARYFGGIDIEDLWTPYFAISTDLTRYDVHRHRTGDLWAAVRASGSIPVLLPPYYTEDGHMLVDGCLLDNVPVRTMHELKRGPNVVVSFLAPELERFEVSYGALPARGALIRHALNPFRRASLPNAPGLGTVLLRSLMAGRKDFERHLKPEDLLLVPPLPAGMGPLDWHRHTEVMDAACAWADAEIARLRPEGHAALGREN